MIRILTSVEITKDNLASDYLRFKYNDNSYQEYRITTDENLYLLKKYKMQNYCNFQLNCVEH
jgi:hypothetical protein